jgi:hypothetical protein
LTFFVHAHLQQLHGTRPSCPPHVERRFEAEAESDGARAGRDATLDAIACRYLARLLGRPPERDDAALLPGIDVSDL